MQLAARRAIARQAGLPRRNDGGFSQYLLELPDRHILAEKVTLEGMAAVVVEELELRFSLHPFRKDIQADSSFKAIREGD